MFGFGKKKQVLKQADGVPDYHIGPQFNGEGAGAFVYNAEFGLPVYSYRGNGRLAGALRPLQHPQVMYPLRVPVSGIGGTIAGQIISQPLVNLEDIQ